MVSIPADKPVAAFQPAAAATSKVTVYDVPAAAAVGSVVEPL